MALWRIEHQGSVRLARGDVATGPAELLSAELTLDRILAGETDSLAQVLAQADGAPLTQPFTVLAPVENQDVWAAGVTYERSRDARMDESDIPDPYDRVYDATRPELFFKSTGNRVRGPGQAIGVRSDSTWDVPEPELVAVIDHRGQVVGYSIGNDVSSRSIEGENPLYLPQAKTFAGSCAVGPCIVVADEVGSVDQLSIELTVDRGGEAIYEDRVPVSGLRRHPQDLVAWLYHSMEYPVGAMLLTGTAIVPPQDFTLTAGDRSIIAIDGLGELANPVELVEAGLAELRGPRP